MSELVAARWAGLYTDLAAVLAKLGLEGVFAPAIACHLADNPRYSREVDAQNTDGSHTGAILAVVATKSKAELLKIAETCGDWCGLHVAAIDLGRVVRGQPGALFIHQRWKAPPDVVTTIQVFQEYPMRVTLAIPPRACIGQIPESGQVKCPCGAALLQPLPRR